MMEKQMMNIIDILEGCYALCCCIGVFYFRMECFLQVQIPEICRQKWRILHLRFGESCRLPGRIT